jgi:hypothetical protein
MRIVGRREKGAKTREGKRLNEGWGESGERFPSIINSSIKFQKLPKTMKRRKKLFRGEKKLKTLL